MDSGVGTILREARNRRKVELSEVEAATRIRFRFLRAIEDEEWDVLPGGVYTRGFIRTYASFLGLDADRLVEDYREGVEPWHRDPGPARPQPGDRGAPGSGFRGTALTVLAVSGVIAVAVIAIVAIPGGGGGAGSRDAGPARHHREQAAGGSPRAQAPLPAPARTGVTVELKASAEVWACLLNAKGKALVDGLILEAGAREGPFHSGSFTVSFGNGEVRMLIDGREAEIPATSSPVGYAIDSAGRLTKLSETERPTCA